MRAALAAACLLTAAPDAAAADREAVARGAYLAGAAGCDSCHTDREHGGQPYAGGRRFATPFGQIPTPNLTPDRATGIGRWSLTDFVRAMRWGISPDDSHYVPSFPFPFYNRLTDGDLADLKAFLDSLPPVSRRDLEGAGSTALVARTQAALAIALTPLPGAWQPDPEKDPVWNRGAYLVASVGHCGDCHTPRNWLGVPDGNSFLAGAPAGPDGKKAPNITQDKKTGIGNWSEQDILGVLTDGRTPDFDEVGGAMAEIVKNTARLTAEDRHAIAVFLQSVPPKPFAGKE
ncbi:MAG TPA: cytochrome c [Stellaceae bacterium]|nr:cytochrome c [Stellaceae bacterium]